MTGQHETQPPRESRHRARGCLLLALALIVALAVAKEIWDSRYYAGYVPGAPLNASAPEIEHRPGYVREYLTIDGVAGHRLPMLLALPEQGAERYPCAIFLHGIGQKKDFLDEIAPFFTDKGLALCSFDQYTRGERRLEDAGGLKGLLALRRRAALTVLETRRIVDYLETRPDIDLDRIYLVGASFGAVTGTPAAAFEPRIRAAVLTYGGGHLPTLFGGSAMRDGAGRWYGLVKPLLVYFLDPGDPVKYAAKIAPRPVLVQAGKHDSVVPPESGQKLYEALRDPKEIIWYDSDHVGLDETNTRQVLQDAVVWLVAKDAVLGHH